MIITEDGLITVWFAYALVSAFVSLTIMIVGRLDPVYPLNNERWMFAVEFLSHAVMWPVELVCLERRIRHEQQSRQNVIDNLNAILTRQKGDSQDGSPQRDDTRS